MLVATLACSEFETLGSIGEIFLWDVLPWALVIAFQLRTFRSSSLVQDLWMLLLMVPAFFSLGFTVPFIREYAIPVFQLLPKCSGMWQVSMEQDFFRETAWVRLVVVVLVMLFSLPKVFVSLSNDQDR